MSTRAIVPTKAAAVKTASLLLQRKCGCGGSSAFEECHECKKKKLQRQPAGGAVPRVAPPAVHDVLRSPGQPLDPATRQFFEPRFSHDFSRVRVHADQEAASSAREVNALAYTVGPKVVFAAGQYRPSSPAGRQLLAHELTHVIQQSQLSQPAGAREIPLEMPSSPYEAEAEQTATAVLAGTAAHTANPVRTGGLLQRQAASPAAPAPTAEFSGCDETLQNDLREKQGPALDHVGRAINALSRGWRGMEPADQGQFRHYFDPANSGEIDDGFVRDVRDNYQRIRNYMQSLSFSCNPEDWTICGRSRTLCRPDGNLMWTCFGALHVCPDPYRRADEQFKIETMIHESTHNALHTTDREYSNSGQFNRLRPRGSGILSFLSNIPILGALFRLIRSNNDTLYNPDSYSGFAMHAGGGSD
jgi:hypothetical protein